MSGSARSEATPATMSDPSMELPRDPTGSYLHLRIKRFASIDDLTMKYAIKTWKDTPHDAEVGLSPNAASKCRQCLGGIAKGDLRVRLFLQCHKGCKNSAYFHAECVWKYPETSKLQSVEEFVGWDDLPEKEKRFMQEKINVLSKKQGARKMKGEKRKVEQNEPCREKKFDT